jgi:hypothetical protein
MKGKEEIADDGSNSSGALRLMLAYLCIATEKEASLERKVEILDKFDLSTAEIATICGAKRQSIRNARQSVKKHGSKRK